MYGVAASQAPGDIVTETMSVPDTGTTCGCDSLKAHADSPGSAPATAVTGAQARATAATETTSDLIMRR